MILKRFSKKTLFALLLCFVALLVAVGAYAYMLNNRSSVELVRMDVSNGLILEVDKTVYELGENVTITFTNNSTETVGLSNNWPFVIRNSEGHIVMPSGVFMRAVYLSPGESLTRVWNQRDHLSDPVLMPVPPGVYSVELHTLLAPIEVDLSVSFQIVG